MNKERPCNSSESRGLFLLNAHFSAIIFPYHSQKNPYETPLKKRHSFPARRVGAWHYFLEYGAEA